MSHEHERCPICGSNEIDYDEIQTSNDDCTLTMLWYCYKCPCWWNIDYERKRSYIVQHDEETGELED